MSVYQNLYHYCCSGRPTAGVPFDPILRASIDAVAGEGIVGDASEIERAVGEIGEGECAMGQGSAQAQKVKVRVEGLGEKALLGVEHGYGREFRGPGSSCESESPCLAWLILDTMSSKPLILR